MQERNAFYLEQIEVLRDEITRYCRREVADPGDAEDAAQLALCKAWEHLEDLRDDTRLRSWLFRIAQRCCMDMAKRRKREEPEDICAVTLATGDCADRFIKQQERLRLRKRLKDGIDRLTPAQKSAFWGRYLKGYSLEELAEKDGVSVHAVSARLYRARRALRETLAGQPDR